MRVHRSARERAAGHGRGRGRGGPVWECRATRRRPGGRRHAGHGGDRRPRAPAGPRRGRCRPSRGPGGRGGPDAARVAARGGRGAAGYPTAHGAPVRGRAPAWPAERAGRRRPAAAVPRGSWTRSRSTTPAGGPGCWTRCERWSVTRAASSVYQIDRGHHGAGPVRGVPAARGEPHRAASSSAGSVEGSSCASATGWLTRCPSSVLRPRRRAGSTWAAPTTPCWATRTR